MARAAGVRNGSRLLNEGVRSRIRLWLSPLRDAVARGDAPADVGVPRETPVVEVVGAPEEGALVRQGPQPVAGRDDVLKAMKSVLSDLQEIARTTGDPRVQQVALKQQTDVLGQLAKGYGADRPDPADASELPVFLGPFGADLAEGLREFCEEHPEFSYVPPPGAEREDEDEDEDGWEGGEAG